MMSLLRSLSVPTGCLWPSLECVQEEKCVSDEETSTPFRPCDFVPEMAAYRF